MKNLTSILFAVLASIFLFFSSCSKDDKIAADTSQKEPFAELENQLLSFNNRFFSHLQPQQKEFSTSEFQELLDRLTDGGLLEVTTQIPWNTGCWNMNEIDAMARAIGDTLKGRDGRTISKSDREKLASSASMAYLRAGKDAEIQKKLEPQTDQTKYFSPEFFDFVNPVNYGYVTLGTHPAYQAGINHNVAVQQLYAMNPEFIFEENFCDVIQDLFYVPLYEGEADIQISAEELCEMVEMIMPVIGQPMSQEKYDNVISEYYVLKNEIEIFGIYMTYVSQLSGAPAVQYTRDFAGIVENSSISEKSKYTILASLSVAINSRFLWNRDLPNPMETNQFMLYEEESNTWDLVTTERLIRLMMSGGAYLWGIPKFNKEKQLSDIIFYKNYWDYIPFREDVFNSLLVDRDFYTVNEPITISNGITTSNSGISDPIQIETGEYRVYPLEEYPDIYVISFLY